MASARQKPMGSAERIFASFLRDTAARPEDLEQLCQQHPEHDGALRRLFDAWIAVRHLLGARPDEGTIAESLTREFGDDVDPAVSLADESVLLSGEATSAEDGVIHGRRVVRYEVRGVVGSGGMGTVFAVYDANLRRKLAMKVIKKQEKNERTDAGFSMSPRMLYRFLEEAQITGQLAHPGIVPVHELGIDTKGRVYFTMELVRGKTLGDVIQLARQREDGWNPTRALGVILKVCETMAYAHAKGVLHRDLKPSNVMVGRFGETYVVDWGLARVLDRAHTRDIRHQRELPSSGSVVETERHELARENSDSPVRTPSLGVVGTPAYMAPEQARGNEVGPRSDVYSIGALLYQLLTGQAPYVPAGAPLAQHTVLRFLLEGPPTPVRDIDPAAPAELAEITEKAMARDARERYATPMEMARDLEAYLGQRPISPRRHTATYLLRLAFQRNKAISIISAVALLTVVGMVTADVIGVRIARNRAERLLDYASAQVLLQRADELYPATPEVAPRMRAWLDEVAGRLARVEQYRAEQAGIGSVEGDEASRRSTGLRHLEQLEALQSVVRGRLELAESLERRTVVQVQEDWDRAIASIRSLPAYRGLSITPQIGLVPLRQNPQGYWEFWHVLSGDRPAESAAEGALKLVPATGMVLVLLPGAEVEVGSAETEPDRWPDEVLRSVEIAPFFFSKYEVTQQQWERFMGVNPSRHAPPSSVVASLSGGEHTVAITPLHPVESVSWHECDALSKRLDLRLPTEDEWEYSCRDGASTAFSSGPDAASLEGHENVLDLSRTPRAEDRGGGAWSDGYPLHAPVGTLSPNGFGLFDLSGNVSEWCASWYRDVNKPYGEPRAKVFRGGSYYLPLWAARIAFRQQDDPRGLNETRGARFARDLR